MFFKNYILISLVLIVSNIKISYSVQLLSHTANYVLSVQKINKNSSLEGGEGRTIFEIKKVCNGWDVSENYILVYQLPNEKNAKSFSSYKTFENNDGTLHSFQLNEKSDFNGENNYEGYVEKSNNKVTGSLINKNNKDLSFNNEVLFPIDHLKKLINKAKNNENYFNSKVFFGSEETELIKIVSAFIGKERKSKLKNNEYLSQKVIWPMKLAFYANESKQSKPDYEITLELDETGIVHFYEINYGDFIIKADLQKIKLINNPYCK